MDLTKALLKAEWRYTICKSAHKHTTKNELKRILLDFRIKRPILHTSYKIRIYTKIIIGNQVDSSAFKNFI